MKKEYLDSAFGNLIKSYAYNVEFELSDDEIERALRVHAKKWGGCVSCRYSLAGDKSTGGNIWVIRRCQVGLSQDGCEMRQVFPEPERQGN